MGVKDLRDDLKKLTPQDQVLAIDLRDRDPQLAFSDVPYVKVCMFFGYLDTRFGRERFDAFLHGYFDRFAFKSTTTEQFLAYLQENLLDRYPGIVTQDEVTAWVHDPGIPADAVVPDSKALKLVDEARSAWLGRKLPAKQFGMGWVPLQWLYFLDNMPAALDQKQLAELDQADGFTHSENAEIESSWLSLAIRNNYQPSYARLEDYLQAVGRTDLITPLYEQLMKTPSGTAVAKRVYAKVKAGYQSDTVTAVNAIVDPQTETAE